ncbi:hypothetical protein Agub_g7208, partial [Astrephomene gubernaculifera]
AALSLTTTLNKAILYNCQKLIFCSPLANTMANTAELESREFLSSCLRNALGDPELVDAISDQAFDHGLNALTIGNGLVPVLDLKDKLYLTMEEAKSVMDICASMISAGKHQQAKQDHLSLRLLASPSGHVNLRFTIKGDQQVAASSPTADTLTDAGTAGVVVVTRTWASIAGQKPAPASKASPVKPPACASVGEKDGRISTHPPEKTGSRSRVSAPPPEKASSKASAKTPTPEKASSKVSVSTAPPSKANSLARVNSPQPEKASSKVSVSTAPPSKANSQARFCAPQPKKTTSKVSVSTAPPSKANSQAHVSTAPPSKASSLACVSAAQPEEVSVEIAVNIPPFEEASEEASHCTPTLEEAETLESSTATTPQREEADPHGSVITPQLEAVNSQDSVNTPPLEKVDSQDSLSTPPPKATSAEGSACATQPRLAAKPQELTISCDSSAATVADKSPKVGSSSAAVPSYLRPTAAHKARSTKEADSPKSPSLAAVPEERQRRDNVFSRVASTLLAPTQAFVARVTGRGEDSKTKKDASSKVSMQLEAVLCSPQGQRVTRPAPFNLRSEMRPKTCALSKEDLDMVEAREKAFKCKPVPKHVLQSKPLSPQPKSSPKDPHAVFAPFQLASVERHNKKLEEMRKKAEEEAAREAEARRFKARAFDARIAAKPLTPPKPAANGTTRGSAPVFASEARISHYNDVVKPAKKAKEEALQKEKLEAERKAKELEEVEVEDFRKSLVFKARPMPDFSSPFRPNPTLARPVTSPAEPELHTYKRLGAASVNDNGLRASDVNPFYGSLRKSASAAISRKAAGVTDVRRSTVIPAGRTSGRRGSGVCVPVEEVVQEG